MSVKTYSRYTQLLEQKYALQGGTSYISIYIYIYIYLSIYRYILRKLGCLRQPCWVVAPARFQEPVRGSGGGALCTKYPCGVRPLKVLKVDQKQVLKWLFKKVPQKAQKMSMFKKPECGQSVVNSNKIYDCVGSSFRPFLGHILNSFWGPNVACFMFQAASKNEKKSQGWKASSLF